MCPANARNAPISAALQIEVFSPRLIRELAGFERSADRAETNTDLYDFIAIRSDEVVVIIHAAWPWRGWPLSGYNVVSGIVKYLHGYVALDVWRVAAMVGLVERGGSGDTGNL